MINRMSIKGLREPIKLKDLRNPIEFFDDEWFPVYSFEGYYEISLFGYIKNLRTGDLVHIFKTSKYDIVTLHHPDNYYVAASFNVIDVYMASVLGETYWMKQYDYRKGN